MKQFNVNSLGWQLNIPNHRPSDEAVPHGKLQRDKYQILIEQKSKISMAEEKSAQLGVRNIYDHIKGNSSRMF